MELRKAGSFWATLTLVLLLNLPGLRVEAVEIEKSVGIGSSNHGGSLNISDHYSGMLHLDFGNADVLGAFTDFMAMSGLKLGPHSIEEIQYAADGLLHDLARAEAYSDYTEPIVRNTINTTASHMARFLDVIPSVFSDQAGARAMIEKARAAIEKPRVHSGVVLIRDATAMAESFHRTGTPLMTDAVIASGYGDDRTEDEPERLRFDLSQKRLWVSDKEAPLFYDQSGQITIYIHPSRPDWLIKVFHREYIPQSKFFDHPEAENKRFLFEQRLGPGVLDTGLMDRVPYLIQDRVYPVPVPKQTALWLLRNLFVEMGINNISIDDHDPTNVIIGVTTSNPVVQTYIVGAGTFRQGRLEPSQIARLLRHMISAFADNIQINH